MTRDIIDINDFTILVETSNAQQTSIDVCSFDEPIIAVAFYGEGNVDLSVNYGDKQKAFNHTKGLALSFYADEQVAFSHTVSINSQSGSSQCSSFLVLTSHLEIRQHTSFYTFLKTTAIRSSNTQAWTGYRNRKLYPFLLKLFGQASPKQEPDGKGK